ncbi:hypothetical protein BGZ95_002100 [Linnemannia exigua]|uniref:Uncharacterized protein n=1 Tax=Linnemannia exigua TaxID=604196 RepID=A0AAD4D6J6_9FUNG|nr:hypothetical protein BGZ95_002100 [Linnemannia exigua]
MQFTNHSSLPMPTTSTQDNQLALWSARPHPLEIPEILAIIGEYFDFEGDWQRRRWNKKTNIAYLLAFIRVSKLWYKTFHPFLWYSSEDTKGFTQKAMSINSYNLMILKAKFVDVTPFRCTRLVTLELNRTYEDDDSTIEMKRQLVRLNPGLKYLHLEGFERGDFGVEDFAKLNNVERLSFRYWNNNDMPFIDILRPMAKTLRILDLSRIKDFAVSNSLDAGNSISQLTLPQLEEIKLDRHVFGDKCPIPTRLVRDLVVHCPGLKKLDLLLDERDDDADFSNLAACLRASCPLLQDLGIHLHSHRKGSIALATLIKESSATGLVKLSIKRGAWNDDVLAAILFHTKTLTELWICWDKTFGKSDAEFALNLLVKCHHLKKFKVTNVPWSCYRILYDWQSKEWGCKRLEEFELDFSSRIFGEDEIDYSDADEEIERISGTKAVMGWNLIDTWSSSLSLPRALRTLFELLEGMEYVTMLKYERRRLIRATPPSCKQPVA